MATNSSESYDSPISHNESRSWFWRGNSRSRVSNGSAISGPAIRNDQTLDDIYQPAPSTSVLPAPSDLKTPVPTKPATTDVKTSKPAISLGRRLFFKTIIVLAGATYGGVKIYKNATPPDYDLSYGQVKSPSFFKKLPLDSRLDEAVIEEALEKAAQIEVHSFNQNLDYVFNHQGKKSTYLTFDLGAHTGFEVDWSLLDFLSEQLIPATVFVSLEVSSNHPDTLDLLNTYPNITLGNGCGFVPRPLATEGQQFNGVAAATSAEQLVKEDIVPNYNKLYELTLFAPRFLRPAIPVFDERATNLVYYLRSIPIGYSVDILHSSSNEVHEVFKTIGARDIVRASLTHGREYSEELKRELLASMGRGILWSRLFAQE